MKTQALAIVFSNVIKEWLTAEELAECIALNKTPEYNNGACATHNYCDANMAMNEAFEKVMGREFVFFNDEEPETEILSDQDSALFNAAWAIAKFYSFFVGVEIVKYATPQNEAEKDTFFTVVEDRETRLLVQEISTSYLKSQNCFAKSEFVTV